MTLKQAVMAAGESAQQATAEQGFFTGGQTATGNSQGTALPLPSDFVVFTTVSASTGTILPGANDTPTTPGVVSITDTITIVNHGANPLSVYPQGTGKIANGGAGAAFTVNANKTATFTYIGSGNWAAAVSA